MKIAVMGWSGAGKSTLARALGEHFGSPVLHLDRVQYIENWQERDTEEALGMVQDFMARPSWIIDGNYTGFLQERRLEEADCIVFLDFPRLVCFRRAWRRYRRFRGRTREDMADGCSEKFDLEFMGWLLWKGRTRRRRARFQQALAPYPEKTVVLCSQKRIDAYWEGLLC